MSNITQGNFKVLQVNRQAVNSVLSSLLIGTVIFSVIIIYFRFERMPVLILGFFWIVDLVFTLYVHFQYLKRNKGGKYCIGTNEVSWIQDGVQVSKKKSDIQSIGLYQTGAIERNSSFFILSFEPYYYFKFKFQDEEELVLTCLLDKDLKKMIQDSFEILEYRCFYPEIK